MSDPYEDWESEEEGDENDPKKAWDEKKFMLHTSGLKLDSLLLRDLLSDVPVEDEPDRRVRGKKASSQKKQGAKRVLTEADWKM